MSRALAAETEKRVRTFPASDAGGFDAVALVRAARPLQWIKNLLVFAGIIFAAKLGDVHRWGEALLTFAAFSLASSAAYLLNDVRDLADDRLHPVKRHRPIASGALSTRAALVAAALLALAAFALSAPTGLGALGLLAAFVALQVSYSLRLKEIVLVDALAIATLFVIRAAAGAVAVDVELSPWLVLCTGLLALLLALGKRRGELTLVKDEVTPGRSVLSGYSTTFLDQLIAIVTAATISAYSLYTFTAISETMMLTIPFVIFGLFRYLFLIYEHDRGEEPDLIAVTDRPMMVVILLWAATAAIILAFS